MKKTRNRATKADNDKTDTMIFRIEPELKEEYIKFCDENGFSYGKRLRALIKKELNHE